MSRGLYITGTGPRSGKSVVILGIMELLAARTGNSGFFRPVAYPDAEHDNSIQLVSKVQNLKLPEESFCGCTFEEAAKVIRGGHISELPAQILEKYSRQDQKRGDCIYGPGPVPGPGNRHIDYETPPEDCP